MDEALGAVSQAKAAQDRTALSRLLFEAAGTARERVVVQTHRSFCSDGVMQYPFFRNILALRVNEVLGLHEELDNNGEKRLNVAPGEERGLTRLTEVYRELSRKSDQDAPENYSDVLGKKLSLAEHRLIDALVAFASKVLFLANHEGLASPPGTPGLLLGGAEKLNRGLFGDFLTDYGLYRFLNSELAERRKQQYVRVLQAVGNTILFSANELRERGRYRERGLEQVSAEVAAVNAVYATEPQKVLNDLVDELRREQEIAQRQHDEATARKTAIEGQLGRATPPKTGLHLEEEKVQALADIGNKMEQLKAESTRLETAIGKWKRWSGSGRTPTKAKKRPKRWRTPISIERG
ncbi:hypothetical protein FBQ96_11505 [Nitrospirales bacterium NOB]|nr:hypothetical protein [Nitrospirota bacterium]MDL1890187.1 hypothetical protein [Nitrospirales bacterium NOB]QOJ34186.1 MAG: hypothetical protein HRU82_04100 [Nitrospira sp.]RIK58244.1 MAG: hypothetical protein DCC63_11430 [Nitrospira sp.]